MKETIKVYYDKYLDGLEIAEPNGDWHWAWYDSVDNSCGWYKGSNGQWNNKNCPERFELIGEL